MIEEILVNMNRDISKEISRELDQLRALRNTYANRKGMNMVQPEFQTLMAKCRNLGDETASGTGQQEFTASKRQRS
jgi:hypothetical protein